MYNIQHTTKYFQILQKKINRKNSGFFLLICFTKLCQDFTSGRFSEFIDQLNKDKCVIVTLKIHTHSLINRSEDAK